MAQAQKGLGRGLEALLGGYREEAAATTSEGAAARTLPIAAIRANPDQPRRAFDSQALAELADSIREQGLLQPVLVRPVQAGQGITHEIVAGERRWRAAAKAGLRDIPVIIKEVDEEQGLALAMVENLQREDLNPMEEAAGYHLLASRFGLSQEALARTVGKSRPAVANALRLLQLPEAMQADLGEGRITAGHARALLSVADPALREALWQRILEQELSVREAEDTAAYIKAHGVLPDAAANFRKKVARKERGKHAPDPFLRDIAGSLTQRIGVMARTSGTADHGRITFQYSSRRELEGLLAHFGLEASTASDADHE